MSPNEEHADYSKNQTNFMKFASLLNNQAPRKKSYYANNMSRNKFLKNSTEENKLRNKHNKL